MRVAYVLTDYPRLTMTFITGELDMVEATGGAVLPISMNVPASSEIGDDDGRRRSDGTTYLKTQPVGLIRAVLLLAARHPVNLLGLIALAARSARFDLSILVRRLVHLAYAARTVRVCRRHEIRHLHAHFGQSPATIAWFAALIGNWEGSERWTWSFTIHGFQDFVDERDARLDLKVASASFVVCVSDFTRSQLCRVADQQWWDRFHVVRCGIDLDRFPQRDAHARSSPPTIATVARLSPEKGHGTLLDALALLVTEHGVTPRLSVIGDGPSRRSLEERVAALGLEHLVDFHGELPPDEVTRHLARADVFCLPSFSEGLPISIMEAMAIGTPVVATHIAGIPELAVHDETALTVPPGSATALAAALQRMLTDDDLARGLATAARRAVEEHHDRTVNVARLRSLYDRYLDVPAVVAP